MNNYSIFKPDFIFNKYYHKNTNFFNERNKNLSAGDRKKYLKDRTLFFKRSVDDVFYLPLYLVDRLKNFRGYELQNFLRDVEIVFRLLYTYLYSPFSLENPLILSAGSFYSLTNKLTYEEVIDKNFKQKKYTTQRIINYSELIRGLLTVVKRGYPSYQVDGNTIKSVCNSYAPTQKLIEEANYLKENLFNTVFVKVNYKDIFRSDSKKKKCYVIKKDYTSAFEFDTRTEMEEFLSNNPDYERCYKNVFNFGKTPKKFISYFQFLEQKTYHRFKPNEFTVKSTKIKVDQNILYSILMSESKRFELRDVLHILNKIKLEMNDDGVLPVYYERLESAGGRLYPQNVNIYGLPRDLRALLFPEYDIVDMNCSNISIMLQLARDKNIDLSKYDLIHEYVTDKKAFRMKFASKHGIAYDDVKFLFTSLTNGCKIPRSGLRQYITLIDLGITEDKIKDIVINRLKDIKINGYTINFNFSLIDNNIDKRKLLDFVEDSNVKDFIAQIRKLTKELINAYGSVNDEFIEFVNVHGYKKSENFFCYNTFIDKKTGKERKRKRPSNSYSQRIIPFLEFGIESSILDCIQSMDYNGKEIEKLDERGIGLFIHDGFLIHKSITESDPTFKDKIHEFLLKEKNYDFTYSIEKPELKTLDEVVNNFQSKHSSFLFELKYRELKREILKAINVDIKEVSIHHFTNFSILIQEKIQSFVSGEKFDNDKYVEFLKTIPKVYPLEEINEKDQFRKFRKDEIEYRSDVRQFMEKCHNEMILCA